jgi:hypothetical protein
MQVQQDNSPDAILILTPPSIERLRDDEGRPLKEGKAPEECRSGVAMNLVECRYAGSRFKHKNPMNTSALHQMTRHWPDVLAGFGYLRDVLSGNKPAGQITLLEFWKIARAAASLPEYLSLRAADPLGDGKLPAFVAAMYKAALGLFNATQNIVLGGILQADASGQSKADPDAIVDFADDTAMLVGEKEVCAGPANMIAEVTRAITYGPVNFRINSAKLVATLGDIHRFKRFANQDRILYVCSFLFPFLSYFQLVDLFRLARASIDSDEIGMPSDLAEQLVGLEARHPRECRSLIDSSDDVRDFFFNGLAALLRSVDQRNQVGRLLKRASKPEDAVSQRIRDALLELINSRRTAIANTMNTRTLELLIEKLSQSIVMERPRLQAFASIQAEMNLALGRQSARRELSGEDISARFGVNLRDIAERHFGIRIENFADRTILQADEAAFTVH